MLPTMNTATARRKFFQDPAAAQAFGLALRARGIEPKVRVNPAQPEQWTDLPDSAAAIAEIERFAELGDELGCRALAWAKASYWWSQGEGDLAYAVSCLEIDLEQDGVTNGAASDRQAKLFLKRLKTALSRAPKVSTLTSKAEPASWDIFWDEPATPTPDTDSGEVWGASIGSNGWRCD